MAEDSRLVENADLRLVIDFIKQQLAQTNSKIDDGNRRNDSDHENIMRRLESHNNYQGRLATIEEICEELKAANLRQRVKGLEIYVITGITLIGVTFGIFGYFMHQMFQLLVKKVSGG